MNKRNPIGRPREKKAPKIKVLISCFPEHKLTIKEFVNQLNRNL
jgi:transposase